jgi:predicted MFS family arabinose efflux permease
MSALEYPKSANWPAVISMSVGVFGMMVAEILPGSMLTPMAADLSVSEGLAGQAVTMPAAVALVTSVMAPSLTKGIDRRTMLLILSALLTLSNAVTAFSATYFEMLGGRFALGVAIGGFWAMSSAATVRLVPEVLAPRALSVVFSGIASATVLTAPLGAYLSDLLGWRIVFTIATGLSAAGLVFQFLVLPSLPSSGTTRLSALGEVLLRPGIALGILSSISVYMVHFAFQTYIRPLLETLPEANTTTIAFAFLLFGVGSVAGSAGAALMMEKNLRATLTAMPVVIGAVGIALSFGIYGAFQQTGLLFVWGFAWGAVPVAWSMWLTRMVPDQRETASGIFVAAVQAAITIGAAGGGFVFDQFGGRTMFAAGGLLVSAASVAIYLNTKTANLRVSEKML